jgi:PAS domain S-box-containing protein
MSVASGSARLPRAAILVLSAYAVLAVLLLAGRPGQYANLHTVLDTGMALLSGMLALILWDTGEHTGSEIAQRLAIGFAATCAMELVHVLVTIEWSGPLSALTSAKAALRPSTWPPPSHLLPLSTLGALLWPIRGRAGFASFAAAVAVAAGALFIAYQTLPAYLAPGPLGITRPTLVLAPVLWAAAAATAWRLVGQERVVRALPTTAVVLMIANAAMLYSRAPADAPAMVAHLGKVAGDLTLLLFLLQMASRDMRERIRAEADLSHLNQELDHRVVERTAELESEMRARRQSQRLLEAIVENSPAVIYVKDLAGRYLMVNRRYADVFHVERDAMVGKTDHDMFPKAAAEAFRAMDERVAAADQPLTEEETAPHDDGLHAYISVKAPLRDANGQVLGVFGISTDVTEQKRAQDALAASEERTRLIIETALDAVITMDDAGLITGWSPQAESIFGWTRGEVIGRRVEEIVMPERYRAAHRSGLARYLATGEAAVLNKRIEIEALHREGHEFPVELAITPIRSDGATAFAGFVRDITERRLAEAKVRTQLERLALLDEITRAIGERQDVQSIFQVVAHSVEDQLPADFACLCLYDHLSRQLTVAAVGAHSRALAFELAMPEKARVDIDENGLSQCVQGRLVYEPDLAHIDFPFPQRLARGGLGSMVAAPLQVEGKVFGVFVVARQAADAFESGECEFLRQLSEHVALAAHQAQLHGALQAAYEDLHQSQQTVLQQERLRALGQMASGIAHDINNALSPVALYTESMLETETGLSDTARGQLEVVRRAVEDVGQTIGRMREFYRQREPQLSTAPVKLNELVRQVIDLTRARWSDMALQRGAVINVETQLATDLPPVQGVESEIREALINLVFNAIDAMPEGGTLTLHTSAPTPETVWIKVKDNGIGMTPEARQRCLEPFFTTKGERGTGLGLAMVYGVAQRHAAELDIQSAPGAGTSVALIFAAFRPTTEGAPEDRSEDLPPRLRLLLVDDDPVLLKALADALGGDGHLVTAANDGKAGIEAFEAALASVPFDLVVTDLGMPYVDGRMVAATIKTQSPRTPVILLTGWGQGLLSDAEVPPHIDLVLSKPPKLREVRAALASLNRKATA